VEIVPSENPAQLPEEYCQLWKNVQSQSEK